MLGGPACRKNDIAIGPYERHMQHRFIDLYTLHVFWLFHKYLMQHDFCTGSYLLCVTLLKCFSPSPPATAAAALIDEVVRLQCNVKWKERTPTMLFELVCLDSFEKQLPGPLQSIADNIEELVDIKWTCQLCYECNPFRVKHIKTARVLGNLYIIQPREI